jgi:GAF domain-containing protein
MEDGSVCGRAMQRREPVVVDDVMTDPLFAAHRDIAVSAGFRAVRAAPLISRTGTLLGVLSLHFRRPLRLTTRQDIRWLELHARRAADAVDRLRQVHDGARSHHATAKAMT